MSGNIRRRAGAALLISLALFCWRMAGARYGWVQALGGRTLLWGVRAGEQTLTPESFRQIRDLEARAQSPLSFALWAQLDGQEAQDPASGRRAALSVLSAAGEPGLVLPVPLSPEDREGCALSRPAARALFGNETAAGGTVRCQEKTYRVRGVFDAPVPCLARPAQKSEALPNLTLWAGEREAEAFLLRQGLSLERQSGSGGYAAFCLFFYRLPLFTGGGYLLWRALCRGKKWREFPARQALCLGLGFALGALLLLLGLHTLPDWWLPSRWSDFSFWAGLQRTEQARLWEFLSAKKELPELISMTHALACGAFGALGALSLPAGLRLLCGRK